MVAGNDVCKVLRRIKDAQRVKRGEGLEILDDKTLASVDEPKIWNCGLTEFESSRQIDAHVRVIHDHLYDLQPKPFKDLTAGQMTARRDREQEDLLTRAGDRHEEHDVSMKAREQTQRRVLGP